MLHIKKIKPLNNYILTTGEKYQEDMRENGLIVAKAGDLKLYQRVIALGPVIRGIEVGDLVMINPAQYAVMKYDENSVKNDMGMNKVIHWNLPWVTMDDEDGKPKDCLLLTERDIQFVFEGEEIKDVIIMPGKPKLLMS